jgi:hypothetical protein
MAGVLPWSYRLVDSHEQASLQTLHLESDNWFVHGCGRLRGYAGCTRLELIGDGAGGAACHDAAACVRAWGGAVASTLPLFFPAHPRLVTNLLRPNVELCGMK